MFFRKLALSIRLVAILKIKITVFESQKTQQLNTKEYEKNIHGNRFGTLSEPELCSNS